MEYHSLIHLWFKLVVLVNFFSWILLVDKLIGFQKDSFKL